MVDLDGFDRSFLMRPFPTGVEEMHRFGEDIVVEETSEDGESTHEKDDVTTVEEHFEDLREYGKSEN